MKRIVIVGGGFGGVAAALRLHESLGQRRNVEVVLISDENHLTYTPLLPDVATGGVSMRTCTARLAGLFTERRLRVVKDRVLGFDLATRQVIGERERLGFDYLIIAVGSSPDFHGVEGAATHALPCRTVHDAMRIKSRAVASFRRATRERLEGDVLTRAMTFVVAGGGCCGVELACELASGVRQAVLPALPPALARTFRLVLVEPERTVLGRFDERLQGVAHGALRKLGVEVRLGARVEGVDGLTVRLSEGDPIESENLIWAAGVRAPRWLAATGLPLTDLGRVQITSNLEVVDAEGVFAVGDCAEVVDGDEGLPLNAIVATQQGELAADNIVHQLIGSSQESFRYRGVGDLISLGRQDAAATWGPVAISGTAAFVLYRAVYTAMAPTLTKKVALLADWSEEWVRGRDLGRLVTASEV